MRRVFLVLTNLFFGRQSLSAAISLIFVCGLCVFIGSSFSLAQEIYFGTGPTEVSPRPAVPSSSADQSRPVSAERFSAALARSLTVLSPEKTLIETVTPSILVKMIYAQGAETRFLCRTTAENSDAKKTSNEPVYAVGILLWNLPVGGEKTLVGSADRIEPRVGYRFQRKSGELLAALAMSGVAADYEVRFDAQTRTTLAELVEAQKSDLTLRDDHSLAAAALSVYVPNVSETWTGLLGDEISLVRLAEYELARPVYWNRVDAADRLLGLTMLSRRFHREQNAGANDGEQAQTTKKIDDYLAVIRSWALSLQNAEGLWSVRFLSEEKVADDSFDTLLSSGHILRWLVLSADSEQIADEALKKSVWNLARLTERLAKSSQQLSAYSETQAEALATAAQAIAMYLDRTGQGVSDSGLIP